MDATDIVLFLKGLKMNKSYSCFAKFYDTLTSDIDYKSRAEYFLNLINKFNGSTGIILDLACGTGSLSVEFAKKGIEVIGVDSSYDMLSIANSKNYENNVAVLYLCQDSSELDLYGTVSCVVCALDSINHITNERKLKETFLKVSLFLEPNGIFIFDCNTIYKHQNILSNNTFVYDYDNVYCVWQNTLYNDKVSVNISLDFFEKAKDNKYIRYSESFCEKAYSIEHLKAVLDDCGLETLSVYQGDTFDLISDKSERAVFVCMRK